MSSFDKMKVSPAFKLFSQNVASYAKAIYQEEHPGFVEFLETMSRLTSIVNHRGVTRENASEVLYDLE